MSEEGGTPVTPHQQEEQNEKPEEKFIAAKFDEQPTTDAEEEKEEKLIEPQKEEESQEPKKLEIQIADTKLAEDEVKVEYEDEEKLKLKLKMVRRLVGILFHLLLPFLCLLNLKWAKWYADPVATCFLILENQSTLNAHAAKQLTTYSKQQVGQVKCGTCEVLLMYPFGALSVRCCSCRSVIYIGDHNRRPPLSVQQSQACRPFSVPR
ncbi:Protein LOL2 [Bienertia sinuspersici]